MMVISLHELHSELSRQQLSDRRLPAPDTPINKMTTSPPSGRPTPFGRRSKCVLGGWRTWPTAKYSARGAPSLAAGDAGQGPITQDFCSPWAASGLRPLVGAWGGT